MDFDKLIEYELELSSRTDNGNRSVHVLQDTSGSTRTGVGSTVWDEGIVAAKYLDWQVSQGKMDLRGKTILELGAGTGLVGITVSCLQPETTVLLSDKNELVPLLEHNISLNKPQGTVSAICLDWCIPEHRERITAAPDLIIVSDGIWTKELHSHLADTLARLAGDNTSVLLAYETRNFEEEAQFMALWSNRFRFHDIKPTDQHPVMQSEDIFLFSGSLKN
ncbi:Protein-lysine N-methyltransferase efm6 [Coemansia sp. Benny D160-2]|nr:Protein-lysine N-methyltransferase efm6 [Coemansia sp. Benny D160-2]